jgi:hypothetical protein
MAAIVVRATVMVKFEAQAGPEPIPDRNLVGPWAAPTNGGRPATVPGASVTGVVTGVRRPTLIHPSDPSLVLASVRDGRLAPVTCAECGCRLTRLSDEEVGAWVHFSPIAGRDARGCLVECADLPHDALGTPFPLAAIA